MKNESFCEYCKKNSIIEDEKSGQLVCQICGSVFEEGIITEENEKRTFHDDNGDNKIQRVNIPMNPNMGNDLGNTLLIRQNGKTKIYKSYIKLDKIQRNCLKIQRLLSEAQVEQRVIEEVKNIYSKMAKDKNMQGRNIKHTIIGIYFYVCRKFKMAETIKEISNKFNVSERIIKRAFNSIKNDIVEPRIDETEMLEAEKNYIRTFLLTKGLNNDLNELAYKLVTNINKIGILEGKSPRTVSGLALLIALKLFGETMQDFILFYEKFSCKNALKKSYEEIKGCLNQIIPQEFMEKANIVLIGNIFS